MQFIIIIIKHIVRIKNILVQSKAEYLTRNGNGNVVKYGLIRKAKTSHEEDAESSTSWYLMYLRIIIRSYLSTRVNI